MSNDVELPAALLAAAEAFSFSEANLIAAPRIEQYFGPWAVEEIQFQAAVNVLKRIDIRAHVADSLASSTNRQPPRAARRTYSMAGSTAIVPLSGALMKAESSLNLSTSTVFARRQVRQAAADEGVAGILLVIDSAGGTTAGTSDLAADVARAAKSKPVLAYCEDLCAAAAYWIASQATKVFANATAIVGSIGSFMVIEDSSQRAENEGVKVHVIRAGKFKGAGCPGTPIDEEFLENWQSIIDNLNEHFLRAVAAGRGLSPEAVRELADGRAHLAATAQAKRLIDGVKTIDEVLAMFPKK
ncbi:MAG TPA: S49 family peptidase [Pirellulales bacterium]|jgi:signal peptide peptidase SppA|nr:S49 family peptidase [Pirellulales bacterium]